MNINEARNKHKKKPPFNSISYTTGDISLNIDRFNQAMGSQDGNEAGIGGCGTLAEEANLQEAKRYVRRYYIRPQNIFCSNKAEIIKALIELDDNNCSIYTLNNLGDEKDVSKLMNSDIIYYYDNGILYDKNRVKVMDYDLSIKKEENRKHFANVNKAPDKEFKQEYSDRMTDVTELEEGIGDKLLPFTVEDLQAALETNSIIALGESNPMDETACIYDWEIEKEGSQIRVTGWGYNVYTEVDGIEDTEYFDTTEEAYEYIEGIAERDPYAKLSLNVQANDAFNLAFDDINAYGEKLTEAKEHLCCICGEAIEGKGENPDPYMSSDSGKVCDGCFLKFVAPLKSDIMED